MLILSQVSDPVALEFSLNTQMFLLAKKSLWISDGSMGFAQESDAAFSEGLPLSSQRGGAAPGEISFTSRLSLRPGDTVYGRVMVDPVQNLGDSFFCSIEKVFLCTGTDGYVPKYDPSRSEFGCLADSPSLLYRFKLLVSFLLSPSAVLVAARRVHGNTPHDLSSLPTCLTPPPRTRPSRRRRPVLLEVSALRPRWR